MEFNLRRLATTASTNDDAKEAAEADAPEGLIVWALEQTAGRGRQGRQWQSPVGNLYFSMLLRPLVPVQAYGRYSFVVALAIGAAVRAFLPDADIELKWPNDVLVGGKKISGILLEAGPGWLVVGMGINVRHVPENPLYPVTSFAAENDAPPELEVLLHQIADGVALWHERMNREGFAPVRAAWLADARKGAMRVRLPQEEIHGTFHDLDPDGSLHLRLDDGTVRIINAGDVFF